MNRVLIVGCGAIGSLYAAHLARVAEVWALVQRPEHARALNEHGLTVSGKRHFTARLKATTDARKLPGVDLAIVATKATHTRRAFLPVAERCEGAAVISAQNGLGSEEVLASLAKAHIIRGTTFMSGTRHTDSHVELELDQYTWLGPFEPTHTPYALVRQAAELIQSAGLKAEALQDARPAQWSKLIFNASVNGASALTELPHCPEFADESAADSLGHVLHALIDEGKRVAAACGIELREDPWEMNKIGAQTNHPPSMLADIRNRVPTEVQYLSGAIAREAERVGMEAPLHCAVYRMIRAKELSWTWEQRNRIAVQESC